MNNDARPNFKILGENTAAGGFYNDARIVGNSVINGDLDCVTFKSTGDSKVNGNLKAESLRVTGSVSITGTMKSENVVISGNVESNGDVHSQKLVVRGGITTEGGIKGSDVNLKGYVTVKKDCESERFKADGQLMINGLLNADDIIIKTYGQSRVSEIGGDKITIGKGSNSSVAQMIKFFFVPSNFQNGMLEADSIEGDEIRLTHTKAKVVRGKNVVIGDGCVIDLVEYKENLHIHGRSSVKEKRKIQ